MKFVQIFNTNMRFIKILTNISFELDKISFLDTLIFFNDVLKVFVHFSSF